MTPPRIAISRLVLINWRGIHFQPFDFAAGVTALEGANGAGKTTVMAALFTALLPDLRLLAFRNVGETVSDDRGLWGRLGMPGTAYTLVEFALPGSGEKLWGGILLDRRSEPSLELKPFIIEALPADADLAEVFLKRIGDEAFSPTLPELKEQVALHGGQLRTMDSATAYLSTLFEHGVLPLPLASHDERERFHRVLATSMMGGLSAFIQKGLRDYLLPEDAQLRSHVGRMRENLEACRVTRRQLQEATARYGIVRQVFDAGFGLLRAAFHGTRLRAERQRTALGEAIAARRRTQQDWNAAIAAQQSEQARHQALQQVVEQNEAELNAAAEALQRLRQASEIAQRIAQLSGQREQLAPEHTAAQAGVEQAIAAEQLASQQLETEQRQQDQLAQELGDAQMAYEQLYQRVTQLRLARQALGDAQAALPGREVTPDNAAALLAECEGQWQAAIAVVAQAKQGRAQFDERERRFQAGYQALVAIAGSTPPRSDAAEAAEHWDRQWRQIEFDLQAADDLPQRLAQAQQRAARQQAARRQAEALGLADRCQAVAALDDGRAEDEQLQHNQDQLSASLHALELRQRDQSAHLPVLERHTDEWELAQQIAAALVEAGGETLANSAAAQAFAMRAYQEAAQARDNAQQRLQAAEAQYQEAERIAFSGGRLDERLVSLAEALDGRLVAEYFDDVAEEDAPRIEARLGELLAGIAVSEPRQAAAALAEQNLPDTLWLVQEDNLPDLAQGQTLTWTDEQEKPPSPTQELAGGATNLPQGRGNAVELSHDGSLLVPPPVGEDRWGNSKRAATVWSRSHPILPPWGEGTEVSAPAVNSTALPRDRGWDGGVLNGALSAELVNTPQGLRITRHPQHPVIGRAAREREVARLRAEAENLRRSAEAEIRQAEQWEQQHLLTQRLQPLTGWLDHPSPAEPLAACRNQLRELEARRQKLACEAAELKQRRAELGQRLAALNRLLPDAELLDEQDWAEEFQRLQALSAELAGQRAWLDRHREHRQTLQTHLHDLRDPPDEAELARLEQQAATAAAGLQASSLARELLGTLVERLPGFAHAGDEAVLEQKEGALAGLRARKPAVDLAVKTAKEAWEQCRQATAAASLAFNGVDARWQRLREEIAAREQELAETGLSPSEAALASAEARESAAKERLDSARRDERQAFESATRQEQVQKSSQRAAASALDAAKRQIRETRPHWRRWVTLKRETRRQDLWARLMEPAQREPYGQAANPEQAFNDAARHAGELTSVLGQHDGEELQKQLQGWLDSGEDGNIGLQHLQAWLAVRDWIEVRIPRDVAQASDPGLALTQIHAHLQRLAERLKDQEVQLKSRTEEVANSIGSRIRSQEQRFARINLNLAQVSFGAIRGVHLNLARIGTFAALLEALRSATDLFASDQPLEEALARLYEQVGGGRIRGEQLLDYREYLKLGVQIRRLGDNNRWVDAKGLSTGESIGVGAAILIVILDAWEHQTTLLRGKRAHGSLRFLFLDEATRLDSQALDTLTDFCERMQVQLLAAAPGMERIQRGIAYTLRRDVIDGSERVLVRGRQWKG
jgi:chromosome partition protein MukB